MKVNGKEKELKQQMNVKEFLEMEGYKIDQIAVEHNGKIIRKNELESIILKEDDQIEVVHFVGGGCKQELEKTVSDKLGKEPEMRMSNEL